MVALGLLYGAAFGIVYGLISYALTGGRRDFVSRQQLQATRYDVHCEQSVLGEARRILGLGGGWPPTDGTATAPTSAAVEQAVEQVQESVGDAASGARPPATP
jgi:hypothetical protein